MNEDNVDTDVLRAIFSDFMEVVNKHLPKGRLDDLISTLPNVVSRLIQLKSRYPTWDYQSVNQAFINHLNGLKQINEKRELEQKAYRDKFLKELEDDFRPNVMD